MKLENGVEDKRIYLLDLEMFQPEIEDGLLHLKYIKPLADWPDALCEARALALETEEPADIDTNPCANSLKCAELYLTLSVDADWSIVPTATITVTTNNGTEAAKTLRVTASEQEISDIIMLCFGK